MRPIIEYLTKRTTSKFLGSFIVFFAILHWGTISTALFVDQELIYQKYGQLKNDYMASQLLGGDPWLDIGLGILLSLALAFVYVRFVPIFYNWLYKYEADFDATRKLTQQRANQKVLDAEAKAAKTKAATSEAEVKDAENRSRIVKMDPEQEWAQEYEEFIKLSNSHQTLDELSTSIYGHNGFISDSFDNMFISTESLTSGDLYGLYQRRENNHNAVDFTDKGKYFLKMYRANKG